MAAHTIIVDLFGIPACGKTSLAEYISEHYGREIKIATIHQLVKEAKRNKFALFTSNPIKHIFAAMILRLNVPFEKKRKDVFFWGWPSHDKYYSYAKKYSDYNLILVDHGDIQSIVTLERGDDLHKNENFVKLCSNYLSTSSADVYVYCKVDIMEAFKRMNIRNRGKGRIDMLKDPASQIKALEEEKNRFDFLAELLRKDGHELLEIDMSDNTKKIAERFLLYLKNKLIQA